MNPAARPHNPGKIIRLLVWGFGLLYVFSRFIPAHLVSTYPSSKSIDDAWTQVLHMAYAQHMQFGRDIVFTYGPWGFLARGYNPTTHLISVAAWFLFSLVFICAGWRAARSFTQNNLIALVWFIGFTVTASLPIGNDIANRSMAWGILLVLLHFCVEEVAFSPLQTALAFTLGWLGLIKFAGIMEGGFLVAVIAADNIIRHRRFPWIIPVWLAGIVFFWLLAGQQPGLLWPFLRNSWWLANGYTDAMHEGNVFALEPLLYVLIGAGYGVLGVMLIRPPRRLIGVFFGLGMGGILFLSFKQGYVGDDFDHKISAAMTLMLIGLACVGLVISTQKSSVISAVIFFFYASVALASNAFARQGSNFGEQLVATFGWRSLIAPMADWEANDQQENYEKKLKALRGAVSLPVVPGVADIYSCYQGVLFANDMAYRPRPIIQSYSAYTPELAKMNADWLRTDRAAPDLFFAIQPLSNRFPSLDDGLSWPELLTRYDIKGLSDAAGTYLQLSRSSRPRKYRLQPLMETNVVPGKPFALPLTNAPIWAEINIRENFAGKVLGFFYKPTILMAYVKLADHSLKKCRMVPGMTRAGFLVSPYVSDTSTFLALAKGDESGLAGKRLVSMTLLESGGSGLIFCYEPQIQIRFYRLDFPPQDIKFETPRDTRPSAGELRRF